MRTWSAALLASTLVATAMVPAATAAGSSEGRALTPDYNRYLVDHLDIPDRGIPDEVFTADADEVRAATTPGVHQNGACLDEKSPREVGDQETFWVYDYNLQMRVERPFTLAAVSDHAYVWVDTTTYDPVGPVGAGPVTTRQEAEDAAADFDEIWDINREYFGEPARCDRLPFRQPPRMDEFWDGPWYDADDDPHINIVNFPIHVNAAAFVAGYYSSADEYPASAVPTSNEGEFFYMNSALLDPGSDTYTGVIAHEFYHMIQFPNDANEESWVNEGMADIAIELNGFDVASHLGDYAAHPEDQLTHWESELNDYGNAYTYITYLLEHYGPGDDPATEFKENYALAKPITQVEADGLDGIDVVLETNAYKDQLAPYYRDRTAVDVYLDRAIANVLNDTTIDVGQYGYEGLPSFAIPAETVDMSEGSASGSGSLHPFGDRYLAMDTAADGEFRLEADPEVPVVPNEEGIPSPPHFVWLNRGDEMRTWMQRTADLTGASAPSLEFGYWYEIEADWDYVYLQVSSDGGATWDNLNCACGSRSTDPNGNNEGNGITGSSGGWQSHSQDLSAYAGEEVLIRWAYQTDAAVTEPGFTLDDVSLLDGSTTIWAEEDFEDGAGAFTLDGGGAKTAIIIEPNFPNQAQLQLVKVGRDVEVEHYPATAAGEVIAASGPMDATRTFALFTSTTPVSSETFDYAWEASGTPLPELTPPVLDDPGDSIAQPFTLTWEPASDAGSLSPERYEVQSSDILVDHIVEDAESLDGWIATTEGTGTSPWQTRSDKSRSGNAFWAGAVDGATDASSILTYDGTVQVPADGSTLLEFWHFHMNESDDGVFIEVSTDGETWVPIFSESRSALPVASEELGSDDGSIEAVVSEPLHRSVTALDAYAGQEVSLRLRYAVGDGNRAGSQPYGWWVDDILLRTTNWQPLGVASGESFAVTGLPAGEHFFRAAALYTDNFRGPWSDAVAATLGAPPAAPEGPDGGGEEPLPSTGGGGALLGLLALAAGIGLSRRRIQ